MDQTDITEYTRRGLRNPRFSSTDITAMTLLGVLDIGQVIKICAPSFFRGRAILTSYTHEFSLPSDCETVLNVFDTRTTAGDITGATNASPIVITESSHGRSDDDIVFIYGVGGNTAANGTSKITYIDADTYSLDGSTGNAAYTSGGKVLKWQSNFKKLTKKEPTDQTLNDRNRWFPEEGKIVVDYIDFEYDLIVDYIKRPDDITDIPTEYHMGLVGWNVMKLLRIPAPDSPDYQDLVSSFAVHKELYQSTVASIRAMLRFTTEPTDIIDAERWDVI